MRRFSASVGVPSESCDGRELGLARFSSHGKFAHAERKTAPERLGNPFGEPWGSRRKRNGYIPTATSSCAAFRRREYGMRSDPLDNSCAFGEELSRDYANYLRFASSDYHYDETIGRLAKSMPAFAAVKDAFKRHNIEKKFIGYAVINFDDGQLLSGNDQAPERYYVHKPESSLDKGDRVRFVDGGALVASGDVFDIRQPEVRSFLVATIRDRMARNDMDAVLIDYAVRRTGFGSPSLVHEMPPGWFENIQESQLALFQELYSALSVDGRELFLNGIMLDSIVATDTNLVRVFMKCCDGMFWEQPFRWEWRHFNDGKQDYYQRIASMCEIATSQKRKIIFKTGTYRYHLTEDLADSWTERYGRTDWGIEKHLSEYFTSLFLIFSDRRYMALMYTHPTELWDVFASEAYFNIWHFPVGEACGAYEKLADHVLLRRFERAIVLVNNTLDAVSVPVATPEEWGVGGAIKVFLKPLSGRIIMQAELNSIMRFRTRELVSRLRWWRRNWSARALK